MSHTIIRTKVRGVTHKNADGESRQAIIASQCREGCELALVREPENLYDGNAIAVYVQKRRFMRSSIWSQIGYIEADLAKRMRHNLMTGWVATAKVLAVTGREDNYGVNIEIELTKPK